MWVQDDVGTQDLQLPSVRQVVDAEYGQMQDKVGEVGAIVTGMGPGEGGGNCQTPCCWAGHPLLSHPRRGPRHPDLLWVCWFAAGA